MNILQISGLALSAVALAVLLRQYLAEYALALGLEVYQEKGVSLEGWRRDLEGWYYCGSDGSRLSGPAADTDGGN